MMSSTGFVNKTYCDMMERCWYTDVNVRSLFEHLLRVVNKSDSIISGLSVKAGSVLTTIPSLSFTTGLTEKQIRIACQKLISTNDISISAFHKKGSIITIVEWDKYFLGNDVNHNPQNNAKSDETLVRADTGQIQDVENKYDANAEKENRADIGQINEKTAPKNTNGADKRADIGQIQNTDSQDITHIDNKNGADKRADIGQKGQQPKEPENKEIPPTPLKENKEEEKKSKEENLKEEKSSSEKAEQDAKSKQMIMPGFDDMIAKTPLDKPKNVMFNYETGKFENLTDAQYERLREWLSMPDHEATMEEVQERLEYYEKWLIDSQSQYTNWWQFLRNHFQPKNKKLPKPSIPQQSIVPYPKDEQEVFEKIKELNLPMTQQDASQFFNNYKSLGWKKNNQPIYDWTALLKTWANKTNPWQNNNSGMYQPSTYGRPVESKPFDPSKYTN